MKLKICISLHTLQAGGGVQHRRVMVANSWASEGVDVTILVPTRPKNPILHLNPSIRIVYLGSGPDKSRFHILSLPKMINYFRENRFDAVFASTPQHVFLTALALKYSASKAVLVGSVHGTLRPIGGLKEKMVGLTSRLFLLLSKSRMDKYFGVSVGVSREIEALFRLNESQVPTIHNPVIDCSSIKEITPQDKKRLRSELYPSDWEKVIVAVGRLDKQKGFDLLIQSAAELPAEYHLVIIGDGEEEAYLKSLINKFSLKNRVHLLGFKDNPVDYIAGADCFVLSSRYEGFGNVIVEALFAQTKIVSFDCPHGPSDILTDPSLGYLVNCYDVQSLSRYISKAVSEEGPNNNQRWEDFCASKIAQLYLQLAGFNIAQDNRNNIFDVETNMELIK